MDPMTSGWTAVFYGVAILVWIVAFFSPKRIGPYNLVALGLAVATFPLWWNAMAAT